MRVVIDIEADALVAPKNIWLVVAFDIDTRQYHIFRNITSDLEERVRFVSFWGRCEYYIGHNLLGYDAPVLQALLGVSIGDVRRTCCDTLILSKLIDYSRDGHSIEDYGLEFNIPKGKFVDFSKWSQEMEDYCVRDVDICYRIYRKYLKYLSNPAHTPSIELEHEFQLVVNQLHDNGFYFNRKKAEGLLGKVTERLAVLDKDILEAFPPKLKLIREITPKETKYGTLSKTDFRWLAEGDISEYNGGPFCRCSWMVFNPSSHKQIIQTLNEAAWSPTDKTQTHIETERQYSKIKFSKAVDNDKKILYDKLQSLKVTGWKVNEANLDTLPPKAPAAARLLAQRILYEARRRSLTEWLGLVEDDDRIHGKFYAIGAWTHRMAHQAPNTANIPNEFDTAGKRKLLGKELRSLWSAPKNRLLVGVDAEGIQLRIFAHYINDPEFTEALVNGKKEDKTDPHSLNQRVLGSKCRSRQAAKRFIYAMLLGAGMGKLAEILDCSASEAEAALDRLMDRYEGFGYLKSKVIPSDAARGYFIGLDGRKVRILGDTVGTRKHLCMSGYLQNGEAVVMKLATLKWVWKLKDYNSLLVNFVHDEWQAETPNDMNTALTVAKMMSDSLAEVGRDLKLHCPLAGSYWNDDHKDWTIHTDWSKTH